MARRTDGPSEVVEVLGRPGESLFDPVGVEAGDSGIPGRSRPGRDPHLPDAAKVGGISASQPHLDGFQPGKVPILSATKLPVALQVQWFVAGNEEGTQVLEPGKDYLSPEGLDGRAASFLFLPSLSDNPTASPPSPKAAR